MHLIQLVMDPVVGLEEIATHLDGLDASQRWNQLQRLGREEQRTLYRKAIGTIDLDYLVGNAAPGVEVIHDGLNTLPVPHSLRRFQKRFCRPDSGSGTLEIFGYNEGPLRRVIGPGYFVASPTADGVMVDYYRVPEGEVAAGWPPIVPNRKGLQRFVYDQTRDHLRRVSAHVCVGAAFKQDKPLDHYFVLSRKDSGR